VKVQCSYCGEHLGDEPPYDTDDVSHGVCLDCFSYFKRQADGLSLGEYLSDLAFPIFIVDHDRRVLAANKTMLDLIGLGEESVLGRRGGEVITCSRARNPGGCGASTHCRSCTVRILVQETLDDGAPRHRVGATLDTETNGPIRFQVSTDLLQPSGVVRVVFADEAQEGELHGEARRAVVGVPVPAADRRTDCAAHERGDEVVWCGEKVQESKNRLKT